MKVKSGAPLWKEVDPEDVVVTHLARDRFGLEAWGYLRSEMVPDDFLEAIAYRSDIISHRYVPSREVRVAYEDSHGNWQVEGTIKREPPPDFIMAQINEIWGKMVRMNASS